VTRLGLTQRVEVDGAYGERRDCLDQAWTGLLEGWGYTPVPLATTVKSPRSYLDQFDLDGLVLTSGNDLAHLDDATYPVPERDEFETAALEWALGQKVPVLGVCRGLELLNHYFGGSLAPVDDHVDTTHAVSFDLDERLEFDQMKWPDKIPVNSYHDYGIPEDAVGDEFVPVGTASDETVECLVHPEHPVVGIMWHPERETPSTDVDRQLFAALFRHITE
jgi:putative glutamine amidotransferase